MRELTRTRRNWNRFFGVSLSLIILALLIVSCGTKQIPIFNGKIWALDPVNMELVRAQEDEHLPLSEIDPDTGYIVMSSSDFEIFLNTYIVNCKEWNALPVSERSTLAKEIVKHNPDPTWAR